ncbi:atos homolog atossa isoform X2 [Lycorma delicatula]
MHAMNVESGVEAFVELGILIVEGRVPYPGTPRGYKEGPHCPGPTQRTCHFCDTQNSFLCKRVEKLRKHMGLLCTNAVPMCLEVLLCAGCQCGKDRAECTDVAVIPSPTDLLLEQWTVSLVKNSGNPAPMNIRGLLQAVRSQLHFSQLSAWWSNSRGATPENVCYRLTLPGQAFASQFSRQPLEHSFPLASVTGTTDIKVSVRTLPRSDSILVVNCTLHSAQAELNVRKRSITSSEQPLLGESLLDPPGPRPPDRIAPSTNRQGTNWRSSSSRQRIGRQNMAVSSRHQDTSSNSSVLIDQFNGCQVNRETTIPILSGLVDDRMQTGCDRAGKHRCSWGEEELDCPTVPGPRHRRRSQANNPNITSAPTVTPAASCGNNHLASDSGAASSQNQPPSTGKKFNFELSQREVEEVLTVLRTRTPCGFQQNSSNKSEKNSNSDITSKIQLPCTKSKQLPLPDSNSSVVGFISEEKNSAPAKSDLLLSAILRTSKNAEKCSVKTKFEEDTSTVVKSSFDLNYDKKKTCVNSKKISPLLLSDNFRTYENSESEPCVDSTVNNDLWSGFRTNDVVDRTKSALCSIVDRFRTRPCVKKQIPAEEKEQTQEEVIGSEDVKEYDLQDESNICDLNKQNPEVCVSRIIPTALDKAKFRQSLDSAASMVFHWRTGLPLTSSPAPLRRASQRFDFDSSINCVSAIRSALFDPPDRLSVSSDDNESEGSAKSPCSPTCLGPDQHSPVWPNPSQPPSSSLLGSFEESVLNGRLEPVSTVQGFTADLGASGSFCPRHIVLPVTVFFYTLGDNDKVSTPYMGHINLGKKGYTVPRSGTIQVTLLNPLGTVIKMFVIMYDLSDMPAYSCTFLRQRTFYMPANQEKEPVENAQKYLRYLIHLRFTSSKSGRISLHTDIRMIIFRKSDLDTATGHGLDMAYELRSFTHGPKNPKFSPRK